MPKGKKSVQSAFFKGKENMQDTSLSKIKSQQFLYLKEILTKLLKEKWEGFNERIKAQQKQKGYFKFGNA